MLNAYPLNAVVLNGVVEEGAPPPTATIQPAADVRWETLALEVNTIAVFGEAIDGSLVSGTATDGAEVQKMGYRLDIVREPAIPTAELCAAAAQAMLDRSRLNTLEGTLTALPNPALELMDVIEVTDRWTNLKGARFRVGQMTTTYDSDGGTISQVVFLCAV